MSKIRLLSYRLDIYNSQTKIMSFPDQEKLLKEVVFSPSFSMNVITKNAKRYPKVEFLIHGWKSVRKYIKQKLHKISSMSKIRLLSYRLDIYNLQTKIMSFPDQEKLLKEVVFSPSFSMNVITKNAKIKHCPCSKYVAI